MNKELLRINICFRKKREKELIAKFLGEDSGNTNPQVFIFVPRPFSVYLCSQVQACVEQNKNEINLHPLPKHKFSPQRHNALLQVVHKTGNIPSIGAQFKMKFQNIEESPTSLFVVRHVTSFNPFRTQVAHNSPAMHRDGSILAELLFRLVHLSDEINKTFPGLGHALVRPLGEVELADGSRLSVLKSKRHGLHFCKSREEDIVFEKCFAVS